VVAGAASLSEDMNVTIPNTAATAAVRISTGVRADLFGVPFEFFLGAAFAFCGLFPGVCRVDLEFLAMRKILVIAPGNSNRWDAIVGP
jgi:hypothetical protein